MSSFFRPSFEMVKEGRIFLTEKMSWNYSSPNKKPFIFQCWGNKKVVSPVGQMCLTAYLRLMQFKEHLLKNNQILNIKSSLKVESFYTNIITFHNIFDAFYSHFGIECFGNLIRRSTLYSISYV